MKQPGASVDVLLPENIIPHALSPGQAESSGGRQGVCMDSGRVSFPRTIQVAGQAEKAFIGLLLLVGAGEGGGDAEGDKHSPGNVALGARPSRVSFQRVRKGAGEERPDTA